MEWILANKLIIWTIITSFVALAAAVTAATPTPKDDAVVAKVRKWLDIIALNIGFAKNADKSKEEDKEDEPPLGI